MFDFKGFIGALLHTKSDDPVGNLKSATIWAQELPESDVQEAQDAIITALGSINANKKSSLKERIQVLMYLDEKANALQETLCRDYLNYADNAEAPEKLFLPTILDFWEEMAESYQFCIREFTQNPASKKIWEQLPLLTSRAIRYYAMQAKWAHIRYMPVENHVWRSLHRLYLFAEREGFAQTTVTMYPQHSEVTTCAAEYLQPLMLHLANPESMLPKQMNMVDQWLDIWTKSITIEHDFRPHRQLYAVNLADSKPGRKLRRNMVDAKYRYWGVGLLLVSITKTIEKIKEGELPIRLKLGEDCRLPVCLELIQLLSDRWAGNGATRQHARSKTEKPLIVLHGLDEILSQIKPGAKPKPARKSSPEQDTAEQEIINYQLCVTPSTMPMDSNSTIMGEPELFEHNQNQWIQEDESDSGCAAILDAAGSSHLKIGTLIGLKPIDNKHFAIGVIRRLNRDISSKLRVGIQTLTQTPIAVELHTIVNGAVKKGAMDAVYLPESLTANSLRSIILPTRFYKRGQTLQLKAQGKTYSIRLQQALEQTEDYARANFDVLAKHTA